MACKNIEKYHLWLWSSLVKILDLSCQNIRFITCGLMATRDKSNVFTRDNHNHT